MNNNVRQKGWRRQQRTKSSATDVQSSQSQPSNKSKTNQQKNRKKQHIKGIPDEITALLRLTLRSVNPDIFSRYHDQTEDNARDDANDLLAHMVGNVKDSGSKPHAHLNKHESMESFLKALQYCNSSIATTFPSKRSNHTDTTIIQTNVLSYLLNDIMLASPPQKFTLYQRRKTLLITDEVLRRSAACRKLFHNAYISRFVSGMHFLLQHYNSSSINYSNAIHINNNNKMEDEINKFQKEMMGMLMHLATNFGRHYPRFEICIHYLEDKSGIVDVHHLVRHQSRENEPSLLPGTNRNSVGGSQCGVLAWRIGRDAAIKHGDEECKIVEEMIHNAGLFFDVIMPRFGFKSDSSGNHDASEINERPTEQNRAQNEIKKVACCEKENDDDEDSDGSSVNWEDGDADSHSIATEQTTSKLASCNQNNIARSKRTSINVSSNPEIHNHHQNHEECVERTLAAMGLVGGMDFGVTINFESSQHDGYIINAKNHAIEGEKSNLLKKTTDWDNCMLSDTNSKMENESDLESSDCEGVVLTYNTQKIASTSSMALNNTINHHHDDTRKDLHQIITKLFNVHLKRLKIWITSLTKADDMPAVHATQINNSDNSTSIVSQQQQQRQAQRRQRAKLLPKLMELQSEINATIKSASKLGVGLKTYSSLSTSSSSTAPSSPKKKHYHCKKSTGTKRTYSDGNVYQIVPSFSNKQKTLLQQQDPQSMHQSKLKMNSKVTISSNLNKHMSHGKRICNSIPKLKIRFS